MQSSADTREKLLICAREHLAERGYYGTSLTAVASSLGLSKQALLHHFKSKRLLYQTVLEQLNADFLELLFAAMEEDEVPARQLEVFFGELSALGLDQPCMMQLLLRELMDGVGSVGSDGSCGEATVVLTFLETLVALIQATDRWQACGVSEALGLAIHLLGAACLFPCTVISVSTVFGVPVTERAKASGPVILEQLVHQSLAMQGQ